MAAVIRLGKVYIAHAGDSRAYVYRHGKLTQLTEDHRSSASLRARKRMLSSKAYSSHSLVRHLGMEPYHGTLMDAAAPFFLKKKRSAYPVY